GKAKFEAVELTMYLNQSSAPLFLACCSGAPYAKVHIGFRKAGADSKGGGPPYGTVTLALAYVTEFEVVGVPDDELPVVKVRRAYGAAEVKYQAQQKDGTLGPAA